MWSLVSSNFRSGICILISSQSFGWKPRLIFLPLHTPCLSQFFKWIICVIRLTWSIHHSRSEIKKKTNFSANVYTKVIFGSFCKHSYMVPLLKWISEWPKTSLIFLPFSTSLLDMLYLDPPFCQAIYGENQQCALLPSLHHHTIKIKMVPMPHTQTSRFVAWWVKSPAKWYT